MAAAVAANPGAKEASDRLYTAASIHAVTGEAWRPRRSSSTPSTAMPRAWMSCFCCWRARGISVCSRMCWHRTP